MAGVASRGDREGTVVAVGTPSIPILTRIWTVLPQESTGPILHGICHQDGDKVATNSSNFLLPCPQKGCGRGMWP